MRRRFTLIGLLIAYGINLFSKVYYVAADGSDTNTGTIDQPLASVQKSQEKVVAGDTVYIRGGEYVLHDSDISVIEQDLFACITYLDKSGSSGKTIKYWAYPGEVPHFNYSDVKPANKRVVGFYIKGSYIHLKGLELTGIQVTILTHTESYCIYSRGSHNIFEEIRMHDNVGTGLRHYKGGYNLFLNCDSYRNHDNVSENQKGTSSDGFGCHPSAGGKGNIFKGCRAWFNSDDGFDCIRSSEAIIFDSCWAMYNGYSTLYESLGDGNGFKAGGFAYDDASKIPDPVPSHTIRFCVAAYNKANGLYSNHHLAGNKWYNNSAYKNSVNYNMVNRESPESDNINVDGYDHILINNLGYGARSKEYDNIDTTKCTLENNYFDITIVSGDFENLNDILLTADRKPDGSLPETDFMKLSQYSIARDKGKDLGFPYTGTAPDLGAFEYIDVLSINHSSQDHNIIFPNPVKDKLYIKSVHYKKLEIISMSGIVSRPDQLSEYIDVSDLNKGAYILRIIEENETQTIRFIKK